MHCRAARVFKETALCLTNNSLQQPRRGPFSSTFLSILLGRLVDHLCLDSRRREGAESQSVHFGTKQLSQLTCFLLDFSVNPMDVSGVNSSLLAARLSVIYFWGTVLLY